MFKFRKKMKEKDLTSHKVDLPMHVFTSEIISKVIWAPWCKCGWYVHFVKFQMLEKERVDWQYYNSNYERQTVYYIITSKFFWQFRPFTQ